LRIRLDTAYGVHMDTTEATAERVRTHVDTAGITRRELSEGSGIPYTTLYRKLNGQSPFTIPEIAAVAAVLGVQPSTLVHFVEVAA